MKNRSVYMDNAATSFPKAPGVADAVFAYLTKIGSNINRGSYSQALEAEDLVWETRELLCDLFSSPKPEYVVFTKNITESLNILIKGLLKPADHVLVSSMEHNAVLRPLNHLQSKFNGLLDIDILPCHGNGELPQGRELEKMLEHHLKPNTKALIITHASNVCGTILPIIELGAFCDQHGLFFLVDSAQTAGIEHLNFLEIKADALAFTGHKGLLGPQGIGGLILSERIASQLEPLITGGTGSSSEKEFQPSYMPDRFEAGTLNIPGIYGLNASLKYLHEIGLDAIKEKETLLIKRFLSGISDLQGVSLVGNSALTNRTAVLSLDFSGSDLALVSHRLSSVYGITNRCGLHCAPLAHKTLGTFPQGTLRLSPGYFNTLEDIDYTLEAIRDCLNYFS
jgi:cysteine desulfurase family protein